MQKKGLTKFAWLSIAAAVATISLKAVAYLVTGSVGLLSDALESVINLVAAVFALWMLTIASRPADEDHPYGHTKAEYFSGALEGSLIGMAALSIAWAAIHRLMDPQPIANFTEGIAYSVIASLINLVVGQILIHQGRKNRSVTLDADGKHLMADVYTSAGVIIAVILIYFTGWLILDPIIALIVAAHILWSGYEVVKHSALGLLDTAIEPEELAEVVRVLDDYKAKHPIDYHALRTRRSGVRTFVNVHVLVPDEWTIIRGHDLAH
ncbi:MAG TPA: cation diffusion facilitator family transporter, partial [Pyrinomonadaceae bacterium]|nr:cation diffusion facilitator family transporter [Pyrinomonadaceae bacterium]